MIRSPRARRRAITALAALTAVPVFALPASAAALQPVTPQRQTDQADELLKLVNAERAKAGCHTPLRLSSPLQTAATEQATYLAEHGPGNNPHIGSNGSTPLTRLRALGYTGAGAENVGLATDAAGVVRGWLSSQGHKEAMLNCGWTITGIAYNPAPKQALWKPVWVEVFGTG